MSAEPLLLLLFRHAHAVDAQPGQDDFDRPLSQRGRRQAAEMGETLERLGLRPDLVLCSPARRTRETLSGAAAALDGVAAEFPAVLYPGDGGRYVDALRDAASSGPRMLIGHNPGMAEAAALLAGVGGEAEASARLAHGFPKAAVAVFAFDGGAADVGAGRGRLLRFLVPER